MNSNPKQNLIGEQSRKVDVFSRGHIVWLLWGVLAAWLAFSGIGIWSYAAIETEPPVFDALSYAHKAQSFWAAIGSGKAFNPLSLEPTIRPFGTVLVSYPFGYSEDFRDFYFRTVFFPIVILALAFTAITPFAKLSTKQLIMTFVIAIAASSAPSNFQFQLAEGKSVVLGTWGFVDTFFSAILALTTALIIRHANTASVRNAWSVAILAAFSLLIKPAGLMLMATVGLVWTIINFPRDKNSTENIKAFKYGILAFIVVYGAAFAILLNSEYLSAEHAQFGIRGMELIRAQYTAVPTILDVLKKFHVAIGGLLSIYLLLGLIVSMEVTWRRHLYAAILVLVFGFWLWIGRTSINNVRYFLPFLMMALVIVTPPLLDLIEKRTHNFTVLSGLVLLTPTLFIGYLLSIESPPKQFQRVAGINLSANIHHEEVEQAKALLNELINSNSKSNIVYYCDIAQPKVRAFEAVLDWDRIVNGSKGHTIPALPIDWVREHTYRIDELRRAKFILIHKVSDGDEMVANINNVDTFELEQLVIRAWLNSLGEEDGVRIHSDSSSLRLLEVMDIDVFDKAATKIYHQYKWRKAFLDGYKQRWLTVDEIEQIDSNILEKAIPLRYQTIPVASIIGASAIRDGNDMVVTIYIKHDKSVHNASGLQHWLIFVQLLNAEGSVQATAYEALSTGTPQLNGVHQYEMRFKDKALDKESVIATGIFSHQANGDVYLISELGDWNGMRNKFTIPAL